MNSESISRGNFAPQGTFGQVWRHFDCDAGMLGVGTRLVGRGQGCCWVHTMGPTAKRNQPQMSIVLLREAHRTYGEWGSERGSELPQVTRHIAGRLRWQLDPLTPAYLAWGSSISAKWSLLSAAWHFISFKKNSNFRNIFVSIFIIPYLSLCFLSG